MRRFPLTPACGSLSNINRADGKIVNQLMSAKNSLLHLLLLASTLVAGAQVLDPAYRAGPFGGPVTERAIVLPPVPTIPIKLSTSTDLIRNLPEKMSIGQAKEALNSLTAIRAERRYNGVLKIAGALETADIPALLAYADSLKDIQPKTTLIGALLPRWGESDPKAAMAFADKVKSFERSSAIQNVLMGW